MPHLNPTLYQALQAAFGSVSVTNDGQPRQVLTLPDWQDGGRLRSQVVASGEQYRVELPLLRRYAPTPVLQLSSGPSPTRTATTTSTWSSASTRTAWPTRERQRTS